MRTEILGKILKVEDIEATKAMYDKFVEGVSIVLMLYMLYIHI